MTAHVHTALTKGCHRCELNVDEMKSAMWNVHAEIKGVVRAIDHLEELLEDMLKEELGLRAAIMEATQ